MSHEDQERLNLEAKLRKDKLEAKIENLQTRHAAREVAIRRQSCSRLIGSVRVLYFRRFPLLDTDIS